MNALILLQAAQAKVAPEVIIGAKPPIPSVPDCSGAIHHHHLVHFAATRTAAGKPVINSVIIVIRVDKISHDAGHRVTPRIIFDAALFLESQAPNLPHPPIWRRLRMSLTRNLYILVWKISLYAFRTR